ncbi:hypothetical protein M7I_4560 [Glarea lozoyensis 74030]|uniref:C2H2-type domain-containing protein n=1 Tax=Glarea lozoyensis (strain ATCC 74030 / MF5533) TaxID=1104152 RepID=H0EPI1_GLAL7|nr:hypothetical protein M7I_4560 [Glarea lozoyensis 74030]
MSLVASHHPSINTSLSSTTAADIEDRKPYPDTSEATLSSLLSTFTNPEHTSMDRGAAEYPQSDPSIAASSPTYPPTNSQYSPYGQPPAHDMSHYPAHPNQAMYAQPRPDWAGYAGHQQQHAMAPGGYPVSGAQTPTSTAPAGARGSGQVYSFVPIPGAQQHKRPRRRYEEIERMYKCGWNGCEKAYGTLNHLNAHVTMQSHGSKRTPEEFKEIRKEWKARKKEEETLRKAEEDRTRTAIGGGQPEGQAPGESHGAAYQQQGRSVQLPPIGYQPGASVPGQYQSQAPNPDVHQLQNYNSQPGIQYGGYPASPYDNQAGPQPKYEH